METHGFIIFCPSCKLAIDANSLVCRHCGAALDLTPPGREGKSTQLVSGLPIPTAGLAVYSAGKNTPITVSQDKEFVLGRESPGGSEKLVDLTELDGFAMGVSRRHAMIRMVGDGYKLMDLNSSNGTWLNGQILVPTIVYDLPSGSRVQLGHLKLVVTHP